MTPDGYLSAPSRTANLPVRADVCGIRTAAVAVMPPKCGSVNWRVRVASRLPRGAPTATTCRLHDLI